VTVDYREAMAVSMAGLSVEKLRVDVTAMNLANAQTTSADPAQRYQPRRVVVQASFSRQLARAGAMPLMTPQVRVEGTGAPARMVQDPGHPDADERGFVAYPGVDHVSEMVNLNAAMRAYQANVAAMNAAKVLATRALEIGGPQ